MENLETLETVKIVKHTRPCGYATINKSDYDSRKHTLFEEVKAVKEEPKEVKESTVAEQPKVKPEVKKSTSKKSK
jgi:hypothetical protein